MGYITIPELNPNLPSRLQVTASSAGPHASAGVLKVIAGISAELDAAAAHGGYTVPITASSPNAYELLQQYTVYGAGWRVLSVAMPNMGGAKDVLALSTQYHDAYDAALAGLKDGSIILSDAPQDTTGAGGRILPRSYSTSNSSATVGVVPQVSIAQEF